MDEPLSAWLGLSAHCFDQSSLTLSVRIDRRASGAAGGPAISGQSKWPDQNRIKNQRKLGVVDGSKREQQPVVYISTFDRLRGRAWRRLPFLTESAPIDRVLAGTGPLLPVQVEAYDLLVRRGSTDQKTESKADRH